MNYLPETIQNRYRSELSISAQTIQNRLSQMAEVLTSEFGDKNPIFLSTLNGAFIFTGDLLKLLHFPCQIEFIKVTSYTGTQSSGKVKQTIGIETDLTDRTVIVLEDIVDTGNTLDYLIPEIGKYNPSAIEIVTLLLKTECYSRKYDIRLAGFEIENKFVIGYGMDLDGYGRNLDHIEILLEK